MGDFPVFVEVQDLTIWGWKATSEGPVYPRSPRETGLQLATPAIFLSESEFSSRQGWAIPFPGGVIYLLTMTGGHSQKRGGASLERQHTCAKYSSEILPAHSMHRSRGRHGLATSAHLIIMRLIRIWFSGKFFPIGLHSQSLPSIWKAECHIRVSSRCWWSPQVLTDQMFDGDKEWSPTQT